MSNRQCRQRLWTLVRTAVQSSSITSNANETAAARGAATQRCSRRRPSAIQSATAQPPFAACRPCVPSLTRCTALRRHPCALGAIAATSGSGTTPVSATAHWLLAALSISPSCVAVATCAMKKGTTAASGPRSRWLATPPRRAAVVVWARCASTLISSAAPRLMERPSRAHRTRSATSTDAATTPPHHVRASSRSRVEVVRRRRAAKRVACAVSRQVMGSATSAAKVASNAVSTAAQILRRDTESVQKSERIF